MSSISDLLADAVSFPKNLSLSTTLLSFILILNGCGTLIQDINQPDVAFRFGNDGRRIADWMLIQDRSDVLHDGISALEFTMPHDPEGTSEGWLRVTEKLRLGWPGLRPESRAPLLKWMLVSPASGWSATRDPRWRDLFMRLRPPEDDREWFAVWQKAGMDRGILDSRN